MDTIREVAALNNIEFHDLSLFGGIGFNRVEAAHLLDCLQKEVLAVDYVAVYSFFPTGAIDDWRGCFSCERITDESWSHYVQRSIKEAKQFIQEYPVDTEGYISLFEIYLAVIR